MASNSSKESPIEVKKQGLQSDMILDKDNRDYIASMLKQKKQNEEDAKKQIPKTAVPAFMKNFYQMQQSQLKQQQQIQAKRQSQQQQQQQQLAQKKSDKSDDEGQNRTPDENSPTDTSQNTPLINQATNDDNDIKITSEEKDQSKSDSKQKEEVNENNNDDSKNSQAQENAQDNNEAIQQDNINQRKTIHSQQPKLFDQFFRNTTTYNFSSQPSKNRSSSNKNNHIHKQDEGQQKLIPNHALLQQQQQQFDKQLRSKSVCISKKINKAVESENNSYSMNGNSLIQSQHQQNINYSLRNTSPTAQFNNVDPSSFNISNISNIQNISNQISTINNQSNILINHHPNHSNLPAKEFDYEDEQEFNHKRAITNNFINTLNTYIDYFTMTSASEYNNISKNNSYNNSKHRQKTLLESQLLAQLEKIQEKYKESETSRQILIADLSKLKQRDIENKKKINLLLQKNSKLEDSIIDLHSKLRHTQDQLTRENMDYENKKILLKKILDDKSRLPSGDEFSYPSAKNQNSTGVSNRRQTINYSYGQADNHQASVVEQQQQIGGKPITKSGGYSSSGNLWNQTQLSQALMKKHLNFFTSRNPNLNNSQSNSNFNLSHNNNMNGYSNSINPLKNSVTNNNGNLYYYNQQIPNISYHTSKPSNFNSDDHFYKQQQQLSQVEESEQGQSVFDHHIHYYQDLQIDQIDEIKQASDEQELEEQQQNDQSEIQLNVNQQQENFSDYDQLKDQNIQHQQQQFMYPEVEDERQSDLETNNNYTTHNPQIGNLQYHHHVPKKTANSLDEETLYQMMRIQHMENSKTSNTFKNSASQQSLNYNLSFLPSTNLLPKPLATNNIPRSFIGRTMSLSYLKPTLGSPEPPNQYSQISSSKYRQSQYQSFV